MYIELCIHCVFFSATHSCQPLLGVNLFAGGTGILNSDQHMWQWKKEAMLCKIHTRDFISHFRWDFLAYCTRPVNVHLAMTCVGCLFNSFWIFLLSLKQQNLMKIMFSCIHFPIWPYPPKIMIFKNFKLVNCTGWQVWQLNCWNFKLLSSDADLWHSPHLLAVCFIYATN